MYSAFSGCLYPKSNTPTIVVPHSLIQGGELQTVQVVQQDEPTLYKAVWSDYKKNNAPCSTPPPYSYPASFGRCRG